MRYYLRLHPHPTSAACTPRLTAAEAGQSKCGPLSAFTNVYTCTAHRSARVMSLRACTAHVYNGFPACECARHDCCFSFSACPLNNRVPSTLRLYANRKGAFNDRAHRAEKVTLPPSFPPLFLPTPLHCRCSLYRELYQDITRR